MILHCPVVLYFCKCVWKLLDHLYAHNLHITLIILCWVQNVITTFWLRNLKLPSFFLLNIVLFLLVQTRFLDQTRFLPLSWRLSSSNSFLRFSNDFSSSIRICRFNMSFIRMLIKSVWSGHVIYKLNI